VRITLGDGTIVLSDAADVDAVLSKFFGRGVTLARSAPADFTIDQYHPDIEGADPEGRRDTVVDQKLGSALFEQEGVRHRCRSERSSTSSRCRFSPIDRSVFRRLS
jgi:hypothetical protein